MDSQIVTLDGEILSLSQVDAREAEARSRLESVERDISALEQEAFELSGALADIERDLRDISQELSPLLQTKKEAQELIDKIGRLRTSLIHMDGQMDLWENP